MNISVILPILVSLTGLYLLIRLRFFFLIHPKRTIRLFTHSLKKKENRRSLSLALAGTLGVGNIFGVAAGIMIGGAGSVFWLLVSGVFSMIIKYSETLLSCATAVPSEGISPVISSSFGKLGKPLGRIYSFLCLLLAFFMGSSIQAKASYGVVADAFNIDPFKFSLILALLLAISVKGGGDKIEKVTSVLIPLTTIIYILISFSVIILNFSNMAAVLKMIISDAFNSDSLVGGAFSFLFSRALKEGYFRGILSNEAGVGTSALAHSRATDRAPSVAGLYGMCEVFFDSFVLCPLTAFAVLLTTEDITAFPTPMSLVCHSVRSTLGEPFVYFLILAVLSFAFSTVICWYYYGERCIIQLFGRNIRKLFPPLYIFFIFFGAFSGDSLLLSFTDLILLLMSLLVLPLLVKESGAVRRQTDLSGLL